MPAGRAAREAARVSRRLPGARKLHTWAGLGAGLWLVVLGLSGFVLDHRDWNWLWQSTVPELLVPERVAATARRGTVRLYQLDPAQPSRRVAGGPQGLWFSEDGGQSWRPAHFESMAGMPAINVVTPDPRHGWSLLWLGSRDGIWMFDPAAGVARRVALKGQNVTALSRGAVLDGLVGVVERSRVFRFGPATAFAPLWIDPQPPDPAQLPDRIGLSRLVHDLHFGRGLVTQPLSLLINDAGAWVMSLLPAGGFLFWWLPRRWKSRSRGARPSAAWRKHTMRWLYRLHGPTLGLLAVVPFLYLTATGILLDHATELRPWMNGIQIPRALQPPVYSLDAWMGEIYGVAAYPGEPQRLSLGTRLGLFTSRDGGQSWRRESGVPVAPGFVWTLRRHGNDLLIGGMGGPNLVRGGEGGWRMAKGTGHMPTDISPDGEGGYLWLNREGLHAAGTGETIETAGLPRLAGVPWYFLIDGLHTGVLIHPQWKWINDLVALACLLLTVTGLLRWWRQRWI